MPCMDVVCSQYCGSIALERELGEDRKGEGDVTRRVEGVSARVRRLIYRQVEKVVDEAKREVLNSCAVAWCTGDIRGAILVAELKQAGFVGCSVMRIAGVVVLLMFTTEDERQAMLERSDLTKWFAKVESWKPEITITNRSAWLSVVGLPMHLCTEESFNRIAQLWGRLIRVVDATLEPQSFEQAHLLIEIDILARVEETVELILGDWSGQIRVQEVEVVHSHDVLCHCESSKMMVLSEVDLSEGQDRESPMVVWDECVGILYMETGLGLE
ncbi:hypothetical protein V6N13_029867 [Hibiscus sabdariffa]